MLSPTMLILSLPLLLLSNILYKYLRNPLRQVPAAHPLAPFTSLWILYIRFHALENQTLRAAHERLGPIICLSPHEVSVNCVKGGIRDVYAGGMEKGNGRFNWYSFFTNYGIPNMFSLGGNKEHSVRKRMLSNVYSKSVVTSSAPLLAQSSVIFYQRFFPYLERTFSQAEPGVLNIYALFSATTMDIVCAYLFGLASGSNLIDNPNELDHFLDLFNSRRSHNFFPQEMPELTQALQKWFGYRLVPEFVNRSNEEIESWTKAMCDRASGLLRQSDVEIKTVDTPVVYQQLSAAIAKEVKKSGMEKVDLDLRIASEVLDHLAAGFDTSGITLAYLVHELSLRPDVQYKLREELLSLSPPMKPSSTPTLPDPKAVDALPFLHAVIWETLRLHSAIPGPQPRITPSSGCRLGPEERSYYIPGNFRVSASAGLLHSNEDVYPRATEWRPERWIEEVDEDKRKDMESRWFWAFGSGGRMCVGSHLAVYRKLESP
ncbi:cytochrome P450 [Clohesyomyces aquaticus]|uniref:Cytochrome P450 n=1 Tax=Clohesyomyces aquaticus TaxID=1231657 RepID=A0A1Y1ZE62_9PLEO|nr:cytochrome P450 [Clohesyomyces aquaticus]